MDGSDFKLYFRIFAIVAAAGSVGILASNVPQAIRQKVAEGWPVVEGEVSAVVPRQQVDDKNRVTFFGRPVYSWKIDGRDYSSDLMSFVPGPNRRDQRDALADVARYQPGMKVQVYYNPADPSIGILEPGISRSSLYLLIGGSLGFLIGGGISLFSIRDLVRSFRQDLANASKLDEMAAAEEAPLDAPLGERIELFKPALRNILAGQILMALLIVGGLSLIGFVLKKAADAGWKMPLNANRQFDWSAFGIGTAVGLALIGGGYFMWRIVESLRDGELEICENGFRSRNADKTYEVSWSMVERIEETILHEKSLLLKPPFNALLPRSTSRKFTVITRSGKLYRFDGNSIGQLNRCADLLASAATSGGILWTVTEEHE